MAYEREPLAEVETDLRTGINNTLQMQADGAPDTMRDVEAPTRGNARARGRQFVERFAVNPPSDPDVFRETAENAYQIFRAIGPDALPDRVLLQLAKLLTETLSAKTEVTQARRASLQVAFLLLETARTLRGRLTKSAAPSREITQTIELLSGFVREMSDAGPSPDTLGRICLETGRIHALLATRARARSVSEGHAAREIIAECLRRANYLHPNLPGVLDAMAEEERRSLLSAMTGETTAIPAEKLSSSIQREAVARGADARREQLSGLFSGAIRETVMELLDEQELNPGCGTGSAIANLQNRLDDGPLKEIERSVLHGLGKVHFVVLDPAKLESPDKDSCLRAGVLSRKISRDRHISHVAVYGGVMAFVEHEPMATDRIRGIMRREGLDRALDELCLAVADLQDGLDLAGLADKCVNALTRQAGATMQKACDMRVIDPDTATVHAGSHGRDMPREGVREEQTCYLVVQDAAAESPRTPGKRREAYARQMRFKSTANPVPSYLRPGSTIILSVADMGRYLKHIRDKELVTDDILRRMDIRVEATLEGAIPLVGTVLRIEDDSVVVSIAGPLTLARYHLAVLRAQRSGGAPFLSSDHVARAASMPQLLEMAGRTRRGTGSTVPEPIFAGESRRDMRTQQAVSFVGRDNMRVVFELSSDSVARLSSALSADRDLARPLRILSELREALIADVRIGCQMSGAVSGREVLERLSSIASQRAGLDPTAQQLIGTFTASAADGIAANAVYDPSALDQVLRERLESAMTRASGSARIYQTLSSLPELATIMGSAGGVRMTFSGHTITPQGFELDRFFFPTISHNGALVELGFTFDPDRDTDKFLANARRRLINPNEGVRQASI